MANPVKAGQALGEPSGELKDIAIVRESLSFDLRPLENGNQKPVVEAIYQLNNDGLPVTTDLVFVANAMIEGQNGVWLDETPVPSTPLLNQTLPASWQPPKTTPRWKGLSPLSYEISSNGTIVFNVTFTQGAHTLRVRYGASPTAYSSDSPTLYWQLGYVLAPARQWRSFGGLDVRVLVPRGWWAASEPALSRHDDILTGSWNNLPADTLALTVQAPPPPSHRPIYAALTAAVGFVVCLLSGGLAGRWLGRRNRTTAWALLLSTALGFLWWLAMTLSFILPASGKEAAGRQAAWTYGYGDVFVGILLGIVAFLAGLAVTQLAAFVTGRRTGRSIRKNAV
jgi:hypothetical protein